MKSYFQTTNTGKETKPKNTFIGFNSVNNKTNSSICIPELLQANATLNHDTNSSFSVLNYIFITLYLNKEFSKCIWVK